MLVKLKNLKDDIAANKTSSTFGERFKFLKQERRTKYQKNLECWNTKLRRVIEYARQKADTHKAVVIYHKAKGPSYRLRTLSKKLFNALWRCWSCDCETPHEARFCIATCGRNSNNDVTKTSINFDFLISHHQYRWCESTVLIESTKYV